IERGLCSERGEPLRHAPRHFVRRPGTLYLNSAARTAYSRAMANANNNTVLSLDLPGIKKIRSGKVRELFDLGDAYLMVASDRLSAFDVIMPNGIPRKGEVLTQISHFWFEKF